MWDLDPDRGYAVREANTEVATREGQGEWMSNVWHSEEQSLPSVEMPVSPLPVAVQTSSRRERLVLFANKYAGTLARLRGETPLEEYARQAGFEPEVVYTKSSIHLRRRLRERIAGGLRRVVVAGGDGTIHSAVQVLANSGVELGILPQGTANNFANALRLPLDLPGAFQVLAAGEARPVSLGEADGEFFTEAAGAGFFAEVLALGGAARRNKNPLRMAFATLRLMLEKRSHQLTLELDGERVEEHVLNVTVANSFFVGLNLPIAPHASLTDDYLDLVLIDPLIRREYLPYYRAIRAQSHITLPKVRTLRARSIRINARHPLLVHVDDRARKKTPVNIRLVPEGLLVVANWPLDAVEGPSPASRSR